MPYTKGNYPDRIKSLPKHAQDIWIAAFNNSIKDKDEESSNKIAWGAVKNAGYGKKDDKWIKLSESYMYLNSIELSETEELPKSVEIMRLGQWNHPLYGKFKITSETFSEIIKNFDDKVRGVDICFDLEHGGTNKKSEAVCWVNKIRQDGDRLLAEVDWTDLGKEKVKSKSFRYFSPEFRFNYEDEETGKKYKNVLLGGGLTNKPFIKKMSPIMLSETINNFNSELYLPCEFNLPDKEDIGMNEELLKVLKLSETATSEEIQNAVNKLVEDSVKLSESSVKLSELEKSLKDLKADNESLTLKLNEALGTKTNTEKENIKLSERLASIENQLIETEWENVYNIALSEGKIVPAMKEIFHAQFIADKAKTTEIIKSLPVTVKLTENGTAKGRSLEKTDLEEFNEKVDAVMLSEKLSYEDALTKVVRKNGDLYLKVRDAGGIN